METTVKTTGLAVSEQTANYVEALRSLNNAGSAIIVALSEHYGEQQGDGFYQKEFAPLYEELRKKIGDFLTISVEETCCNKYTPQII